MSQASSQASAFYRDVASNGTMWIIEDDGGYPAPMTVSGKRAMPFWSSRARAERIIKNAAAYAGFRPVEVSWQEFCEFWVADLEGDGLLIGVNWSGPRVTGYDIEPSTVRDNVLAVQQIGDR